MTGDITTRTEHKLDTSTAVSDEVKTTTCYMCACRCGIRVTLENGEVRFIQGNPEHPINEGGQAFLVFSVQGNGQPEGHF